MTFRSPFPRLVVVGLAAVLAFSACGGDDDSDDGSDDTSTVESTEADAGNDDTGSDDGSDDAPISEDAIAAAIEAQAEELGIEDTREEDDGVVLIMADGSSQEDADAACELGSQLYTDGTISVEIDGEVSPCA